MLQRGWSSVILEVPSNPSHSMILQFYEMHLPPHPPFCPPQAMESKLLIGGRTIVDHTNEQQKMLELKRQEIAEQVPPHPSQSQWIGSIRGARMSMVGLGSPWGGRCPSQL